MIMALSDRLDPITEDGLSIIIIIIKERVQITATTTGRA